MPRRVLAIDDSATLRAILRAVLSEAGYEVDTASDGAEGLERVQRHRYDLVLVDFVMPRLNGYQFAQALRSIAAVAQLPVVLVSAKADQIADRFMAQTGAVAALAKPFTPRQLLDVVALAVGDAPPVDPDAPAGQFAPTDAPPRHAALTVGPPAHLNLRGPLGSEASGWVTTRELRAPGAVGGALGAWDDEGPTTVAPADDTLRPASLDEAPLLGEDEAAGFLSWLQPEGDAAGVEPGYAYDDLVGAAREEGASGRTSWPPGGLQRGGAGALLTAQAPSLGSVQEGAYGRFAEALGRVLLPAIRDLAATAGNVTEEVAGQVLRSYLSAATVGHLATELRALDPALRGVPTLEGMLGAVPLGEVFQLLSLQAQSGLLVIEREGRAPTQTVTVALRGGRVDQAVSQHLGGEFLLGRYLVSEGVLGWADITAFSDAHRGRKVLLGEALVAAGLVQPMQLEAALRRQTSELVYEVLRWGAGRFRFEASATLAAAQQARLALASDGLVLEAYRRLDEWRLIGEYLPSEREVLRADPATLAAVGVERLDRDERRVLAAVDGRRTVREVVHAVAMSSFDTSKILYRLVRARLVSVGSG